MFSKHVNTNSVGFLLVLLLVTSCSTSSTTITPTDVVQPTAAVLKATSTPAPAFTVRFTDGDKCGLEGATSIPAGDNAINWVVDSTDHQSYGMNIAQIDPGMTVADLQALDGAHWPSWFHSISESSSGSGSQSIVNVYGVGSSVYGSGDSIYILCATFDTGLSIFGVLGPVPIVKMP